MCVCVSLYTTVIHNTAQNSSDNLASYRPDNYHSLDDVYLRGRAHSPKQTDKMMEYCFMQCSTNLWQNVSMTTFLQQESMVLNKKKTRIKSTP